MRLSDWVDDQLREWREVDARELAEQAIEAGVFDDDYARAALIERALYDVRKALKRRKGGLPVAANLTLVDEDGTQRQFYKALTFFDASDYQVLVRTHIRRAKDELDIARAFAEQANELYELQLVIPELVVHEATT